MDYRLKKAYEKIHKPSNPESVGSPKTLADAYSKIVNERLAFYYRNVPAGEEAEKSNDVYTLIGTSDDDKSIKRIKNTLESSRGEIHQLIAKAGKKWTEAPDYNRTILGPVYSAFAEQDIESTLIKTIIDKKAELNNVEDKIDGGAMFNLTEEVASEGIFSSHKENIKLLFDSIFSITLQIDAVGVGEGELALSLLTGCSKGKIGDLVMSPKHSSKGVEIKVTNGRIGKADQFKDVQNNIAKNLYSIISTSSTKEGFANQNTGALIDQIEKRNKELNKKYPNLFKSEFVDKITDFVQEIQNEQSSIEECKKKYDILFGHTTRKNTKSLLPSAEETSGGGKARAAAVYEAYCNAGYVDRNVAADRPPEDLASIQNYVNSKHTELSRLARGLLVDKFDLQARTSGDTIEEFFKRDYKLTVDQLVDGLLTTVSENYHKHVQQDLSSIRGILQNLSENKKMTKLHIQALVCALHMKCYSTEENFQYFLLIDNKSNEKPSLGINCSSFAKIYDSFVANKLKYAVAFDDRGGGRLSFGKSSSE